MKILSTLAAAFIACEAITPGRATEHVQRSLILGGSVNPIGTKRYTTGLRPARGANSVCAGALVSPSHVLTTVACANSNLKFAAVGAHYLNGTTDGEEIAILSIQKHPLFNPAQSAINTYDFAIVTLATSSKIPPAKLPKGDNSEIVGGMSARVVGWGVTSYPKGPQPKELQRLTVQVWSKPNCSATLTTDDTFICAGGQPGKDSCDHDNGGPLLIENGRGDADDVLIGLSSWGYKCGLPGVPSAYSRVSAALPWINAVTKGKGTRH